MTQAVSRRPFTAQNRVRFKTSSCDVCGRPSGFSPRNSVFSCIIQRMLLTYLHLNTF